MTVFSLSCKNGLMQGSANSVKGQRVNISGSVFYIICPATQLYYCGTKAACKILKWMGVAAFQQTVFAKTSGRLDLAGGACRLLTLI